MLIDIHADNAAFALVSLMTEQEFTACITYKASADLHQPHGCFKALLQRRAEMLLPCSSLHVHLMLCRCGFERGHADDVVPVRVLLMIEAVTFLVSKSLACGLLVLLTTHAMLTVP